MKYLLDTDWAISFPSGRANAIKLIDRLADQGLGMSVIAWGEIYEGLLASPDPLRHLAQFDKFTDTLDLIAPDIEVARHYATTRAHLRSQGLLIPDNELWIAATGLAHDLTLVSRDEHFSRVPGLTVYESEAPGSA